MKQGSLLSFFKKPAAKTNLDLPLTLPPIAASGSRTAPPVAGGSPPSPAPAAAGGGGAAAAGAAGRGTSRRSLPTAPAQRARGSRRAYRHVAGHAVLDLQEAVVLSASVIKARTN